MKKLVKLLSIILACTNCQTKKGKESEAAEKPKKTISAVFSPPKGSINIGSIVSAQLETDGLESITIASRNFKTEEIDDDLYHFIAESQGKGHIAIEIFDRDGDSHVYEADYDIVAEQGQQQEQEADQEPANEANKNEENEQKQPSEEIGTKGFSSMIRPNELKTPFKMELGDFVISSSIDFSKGFFYKDLIKLFVERAKNQEDKDWYMTWNFSYKYNYPVFNHPNGPLVDVIKPISSVFRKDLKNNDVETVWLYFPYKDITEIDFTLKVINYDNEIIEEHKFL